MDDNSLDILDVNIMDLPDLPSYKPFPVGFHKASITFEVKVINKKTALVFKITYIECIEQADPEETPARPGDETSVSFFIGKGNEISEGFLKELIEPATKELNIQSLRDFVNYADGMTFGIATAHRFDKNDKTKIYTNLKALTLL